MFEGSTERVLITQTFFFSFSFSNTPHTSASARSWGEIVVGQEREGTCPSSPNIVSREAECREQEKESMIRQKKAPFFVVFSVFEFLLFDYRLLSQDSSHGFSSQDP